MKPDKTEATFTTKETAILATFGLRALTEDRRPLEALHEEVLKSSALEIDEGAIKKAIEDRIVSVRHGTRKGPGRTRLLNSAGVVYLAVQGAIDLPLPKQEKRRLHDWIQECMASRSPTCKPLRFGKVLSLEASISSFLWYFADALDSYCHDRAAYVEINPRVLGGTPVVRGTRISVYAIAGRLDEGETLENLAADYPHVEREALKAAYLHARANPRVGRPKLFR